MQFVRNNSLGRRLTWQAVFASALVAVFACAAMVGWETMSFRRTSRRTASTQAEFISRALAGNLARRDIPVVQGALSALEGLNNLETSGLYLADGEMIATFRRPGSDGVIPDRPDDEAFYADDRHITIFEPVTHGGRRVGTLYLQLSADAGPLSRWRMLFALAVTAFALPLGWILSKPPRDLVSTTFQRLTRLLRAVARETHPTPLTDAGLVDELKDAVAEVNRLLDGVEARDKRLDAFSQDLEQQVQARTAELARKNRDLRTEVERNERRRDKAETESAKKSTFLARMSHELRTPMNGILGMTDLLLRSGIDSEQRHLADTVRQSGNTLLDIINDILDYSKIEAGMLELDNAEFELRSIIDDCLQLLAERAHQKGLDLACRVDDAVPTSMSGDAQRLRQILINLLGNAIKFTASGEVTVQVATVHEASGRVVLRFEITDTGPGIDPDAQECVFESFAQVNGASAGRQSGTGLGLAISRQLAYLMRGEIGLESEPDRGSTFWFTACFDNPLHDAARHVAGRRDLADLRIVIAGPSSSSRTFLRRRLESWGVDVSMADDLAEARVSAEHEAEHDRTVHAIIQYVSPSSTPPLAGAPGTKSGDHGGIPEILLLPLTGAGVDENTTGRFAACLRTPVRAADLYRVLGRVTGRTAAEAAPDPAASESAPGLAWTYRANILVAEDNPVNQEVARGMLESFGCDVTIAADGKEAVQCVREGSFDLVFMDCQMPVMNGYDAAQAIHDLGTGERSGDEAWTAPTVVALTSEVGRGAGPSAARSVMDDLLGKPFRSEELAAMLYRWLSPRCRQARDDSRAASSHTPTAAEPTPGDALDLDVLERIRGLQGTQSENLLEKVVQSYLDHTPHLMNDLEQAVGEGHTTHIRSVAHTLKSSSANVGAQWLAEDCRQLELLAEPNMNGEALRRFQEIGRKFEAASSALSRQLKRRSS